MDLAVVLPHHILLSAREEAAAGERGEKNAEKGKGEAPEKQK